MLKFDHKYLGLGIYDVEMDYSSATQTWVSIRFQKHAKYITPTYSNDTLTTYVRS